MPGLDVNQSLLTSRLLPVPVPDGVSAPGLRGSRYREQYIESMIPTKHLLADEGSYFNVTQTIGTALAYGIITAFSDTAAFLVVMNNDVASNRNAKRLWLDYAKLLVEVVPVTATRAEYAIKTDNVSRVPSANSSNLTSSIVCPNNDLTPGSIAKVWAASGGTMTVPASGSQAKVVARGSLRNAIPVLGDELAIRSGQVDGGANGTQGYSSPVAPIIIGPQQFIVVYLWFPGNATTALSYEGDLAGWWER